MTWFANSEGRYGVNGAKGDQGEKIVEEYCNKNNIKCEPKTDKNSQVNLKIDFIINDIPIDVKSNFYKGFLAVELYTKKSGAGWLFTSTAEQIYGVDVESRSIYRYNIKDMLHYVAENKKRAKRTKKGDVIMWVPITLPFIECLQ